jgi:hypothetical protein
MVRSLRCSVVVAGALLATLTIGQGAAGQGSTQTRLPPPLTPTLDSVRANLEKYQNVMTALADGYLSTVACIHFPMAGKAGETPFPVGAMGVHFLNGALIGKPLDAAHPQALIYELHGDTLKLAAAEWFVPVAVSAERPAVFGHPLDGPMDGHVPIMPAELRHWDLHVWLWKANPAGVFTPTNPAVTCPKSVNTVEMHEMHGEH